MTTIHKFVAEEQTPSLTPSSLPPNRQKWKQSAQIAIGTFICLLLISLGSFFSVILLPPPPNTSQRAPAIANQAITSATSTVTTGDAGNQQSTGAQKAGYTCSFEAGESNLWNVSSADMQVVASRSYSGAYSLQLILKYKEYQPQFYLDDMLVQPGVTMSIWIYVASDTIVPITANWTAKDRQENWYGQSPVILPIGSWYKLSYAPDLSTETSEMGISFIPPADGKTYNIYVDMVSFLYT